MPELRLLKLTVTALIGVGQIGFAQQAPLRTNKGKTIPATPGFVGQDIEIVIKRLLASTQPKSEFETTEQYDKRLGLAYDGAKHLVFVLRIGEDDGDVASLKFDADSQTMTARLWGILPWLRHEEPSAKRPRLQVQIKRSLVSSRRYMASNSLGAKTVVSSKEYDEFGLALDGNGLLAAEDSIFSWAMTIDEAKSIKPFLGVAVSCVQNGPNVYTDQGRSEATIANPQEYIHHYFFLPVLVEQLWVFDTRSGKILKRFGGPE